MPPLRITDRGQFLERWGPPDQLAPIEIVTPDRDRMKQAVATIIRLQSREWLEERAAMVEFG